VIRRFAALSTTVAVALGSLTFARSLQRRASRRLLEAPRIGPDEAGLAAGLDAAGGEIVRLRARDGVGLAARWLPADPTDPSWTTDPREAILLLHGYTGSIAPDIVEYAPSLRRTAGVLGLDFRGHGGSDAGPTTFGFLETEDIAGALHWLGQRGVHRVALFGTSMGGISALTAVAVLGDGQFTGADVDPAAPRDVRPEPRPAIVAVIADSVAPELELPVASRLPGPAPRFLAARLFDGAARTLGGDPRATEPIRVIGLLEPLPILLIHGYGLNAHTWDAIALGLSPRYRSIVLDQLGHGLSDWGSHSDYTLDARARAAEPAAMASSAPCTRRLLLSFKAC